ncbi:MAG: 5-formyltetrahydrofolate cyclo-ligase [Clostridiaceae bacterium]|nr:5-formyltetrahydrofolate cyclo-ligase [Clostridiaceae bacterium]
MDKSKLKTEIIEKRKLLDESTVKNASETIVRTLQSIPAFKQAKVVLSYMPYGKEVDIRPLNQWILDQGKVLCLPKVISKTEMEARAVNDISQGLYKSGFGVLEPTYDNELMDIDKIELVLVPGLAFDKTGNRMGHGNGYYDRFLASCPTNTILIGIAYAFQVFDSIPFDQYDVKVHRLITEKFTLNFKQ